jgi:hypothetical protein
VYWHVRVILYPAILVAGIVGPLWHARYRSVCRTEWVCVRCASMRTTWESRGEREEHVRDSAWTPRLADGSCDHLWAFTTSDGRDWH